MDDEKITALAREYAEESIDPQGFSKDTYEELVEEKAENAAYVIRFLLPRFYLVEKSKVEDEYDEARVFCENVDPCGESYARNEARMALLESLFPEIAKEVKG